MSLYIVHRKGVRARDRRRWRGRDRRKERPKETERENQLCLTWHTFVASKVFVGLQALWHPSLHLPQPSSLMAFRAAAELKRTCPFSLLPQSTATHASYLLHKSVSSFSPAPLFQSAGMCWPSFSADFVASRHHPVPRYE